ncbi:hypothetical protein HNR46_002930 [Haloferula luteola]|uniref:Uncharacterized protein n=1 Tax=Haloferula luteola TaxID=595692 RepID=A0A840V3X2_9BACT|nr:hypothetical protein [Haloferula luteola]MBB5352682.1 hypothetical protein [Haloferula luteola]
MSMFAFDCSQFIAIRSSNPQAGLGSLFDEALRITPLVDESKKQYLEKVLGLRGELQLFEVGDEEFQGDFEEWNDIGSAPPKLESLIELILKLAPISDDLDLVLVQSATTNADRIWRCECLAPEFRSKLFAKSIYSVEEGSSAEVSIYRVRSKAFP